MRTESDTLIRPRLARALRSLAPSLRVARRNLMHDRARLAVALVGVAFAVFLMLVQSAIYLGFMGAASAVIDLSRADLWIVAEGSVNFESAPMFSEDELSTVRGTPGIARAEAVVHSFGYLKLPDGQGTWAQMVGFDPDSDLAGPRELVEGTRAALKKPDTYIVDRSSLRQMPGVGVGSLLEINDLRMEVAGVCTGARTQTTYPMLFTSLHTARQMPLNAGRANFIVATLARGADRESVAAHLRRLGRFDVLERDDFSRRTSRYWATKTGIGIGIGVTIALGFLVGLVIAGQTLYTSTVERLREYATLKALGATNADVCATIVAQALMVGVAGYVAGAALAAAAAGAYSDQAVAMRLTGWLFAAVFAGSLFMCLGAALLSVVRVLRVSPGMVFRA